MMKTIWFTILFFVLTTAPDVCGKVPKSHVDKKISSTSSTISSHSDKNTVYSMTCRLKQKTKYISKEISEEEKLIEKGKASYYHYSERHILASGERYNSRKLTAAHKTLPFGTQVKVTRLDTKQSVIVIVNDRGPFKRGRIIDLNIAAAKKIGLYGRKGIAYCIVEVIKERKRSENELSLLCQRIGKDINQRRMLVPPKDWYF
jgi:rare lipoprotein A